jgi:hypothetical protein
MFLLLFRFAVGYGHTVLLPTAYAMLRCTSNIDAGFYRFVTALFGTQRMRWRQGRKHFKDFYHIAWMQDPLPLPWRFAVQVFTYEHYWRLPLLRVAPADQFAEWEYFQERFGSERTGPMFREDEFPWPEERANARQGELHRAAHHDVTT